MWRNALMIGAILAASPCGYAWEFRSRLVERIGNVDVVLNNNNIDGFARADHRIRIQFGVFDDAEGAAPAGGFVGWNVGTINVSGWFDNSDESRTPGRLVPFVFTQGPNSNGSPPSDPFERLTDIDASLGLQPLQWTCGPDGQPPPMPQAVVRGLNTFVSVYEITTHSLPSSASYLVTFAGNLIAASEWRTVGTPIPPDCDNPAEPGGVDYAPLALPPEPFTRTLRVTMPAPGAAAVLGGMLAICVRRRRQ